MDPLHEFAFNGPDRVPVSGYAGTMTSEARCVLLFLPAYLAGCGAATPGPADPTVRRDIDAVLDGWHAAAAASDEEAYFALMTPDAIFLGTDATERWTREELRAYAHPHFAARNGWVMRSVRRDVYAQGDVAWFDEDLDTENLGPARGSGVLRRTPDGWRIAHYNLALTIPNDRFRAVRDALLTPSSSEEQAP